MSYRERIYRDYLSASKRDSAKVSLSSFSKCEAYLVKMINDHFPSDRASRILDLGCGHGALLYFAQRAGYRNIIGVDRSPQQCLTAKNLGISGIQEGDLFEFLRKTPDGDFDVIVAFDVLEHFTRDEACNFIDEVSRSLKAGGKCIIHLPNGESPFGSRIRYADFSHEMAYTRLSINQLLLSSGFTLVSTFEDRPVSHGFKSLLRAILWRGIRLICLIYLAIETGELNFEFIFSQNFLVVAVK